jgi:hypothetical protein
MNNTKKILATAKESFINAEASSAQYIDGLVFTSEYLREDVLKGIAQFLIWAKIDTDFDVIKTINGWKVVAL